MCKTNTWHLSKFVPSNQFQQENAPPRILWNQDRGVGPNDNLPRNTDHALPVYPNCLPLLINKRPRARKLKKNPRWIITSIQVNPITSRSNRFLREFQWAHDFNGRIPTIHNYPEWKVVRASWVRYIRKRVRKVIFRELTTAEEFSHLYTITSVLATICWPPNHLKPQVNWNENITSFCFPANPASRYKERS